MAKNYGISWCNQVLKRLDEIEEQMFKEKGHGFDIFGEELVTQKKYRRLLRKFTEEKELGLPPSYRPIIHGSPND
ncbi:hypothetical protein OTK49_03100 [Vibrio coralliirubri]|uniref:hypothetical protein n=1 Tax=Vibrio coralliirubri TaxID=1516159 RepID=UPI0022842D35|nr:hypothetical protein [Vibrio coralliirubri]MCY9861503.1 hypothetical protein [Vibrio coralliirubri]